MAHQHQTQHHPNPHIKGSLKVHVIEACDLAIKDWEGTSDPYAILTFHGKSFRTTTVYKELYPHWSGQEFTWSEVPKNGHLTVELWDEDQLSTDDFLGKFVVDVGELEVGKKVNKWFVLKPKKPPPT
eukprot:TRINITY_DN4127_c0_g4_i4.p1 TRINITY_DN4127_c0_g4~~TRINITY_DN4127_c0_g4_i4.p1  ORF type:complete len:138 (+),score=25.40 TRINITY_DN4127_c0_g4_i4:35-415(+)